MNVITNSSPALISSILTEHVSNLTKTVIAIASIASVLLIIFAGYNYIVSSGNPTRLIYAKNIIKNTIIGLMIIFAATSLINLLNNAYNSNDTNKSELLPTVNELPAPKDDGASNGLILDAVIGLLSNIISTLSKPILQALDFFTKSTPLMAKNSSVFSLWMTVMAISNTLLILVVVLIGFHVMSATSLGFDEIDIKSMFPKIILVFILMNSSIFIIDSFIQLSNILIGSIGNNEGSKSLWDSLTAVLTSADRLSVAALLIMVAFVIIAVILLVYYVSRIVTLFIGAILSPLLIAIWLIPGFKGFSESAFKTYLSVIFTLFIHVVILHLASSLILGISTNDNNHSNAIMSAVTGIATILALLKTQGVLSNFTYLSMSLKSMKNLSNQFFYGLSNLSNVGSANNTLGNYNRNNFFNDKNYRTRPSNSSGARTKQLGSLIENKASSPTIQKRTNADLSRKVKITKTALKN